MSSILFSKVSALIASLAILSLTFLYPYSGDNALFAYIADSSQDARPFLNGLMPHEFIRQDFTEIGEWLDQDYKLDTLIGSFFIYGRKR